MPVLRLTVVPVLLTAATAHELSYNHAPPSTWAAALAMIWVLVLRRFAPVAVLATCLAIGAGLWASHTTTFAALALPVALYGVAATCRRGVVVAATATLEAAAVLAALRFAPHGSVDDASVFLTGLVAAALFLGTTVRANRRNLAFLEERAELAAAAERARIARETHDIVAHGLSVVITLAEGAAANAETDPPAARAAMEQVAASGRQSLDEMRKLLDVLRVDAPADRTPQPDLAALDALVADVRSTGLAVELKRSGDPVALSPTAQATVYRVVQEALTNVLKHARRASRVTVSLEYGTDRVCFAICDDGRPGPRTGRGNGLSGMRERVAMFDGTLDAGTDGGGWHVRGELRLT